MKARVLYLLSPAKTLDMSKTKLRLCSEPKLLFEANVMMKQLQTLSRAKVKTLLGVSDALAQVNYDRYQDFAFLVEGKTTANGPTDTLKQAILAFNGPAYQGLAANELSQDELEYAQDHLRILCGLYGMLRPLDLIQAYRLEMGQKFATSRGKDLYAFWGTMLAEEINAIFTEQKKVKKIVVNVASQEYFKSIAIDALDEDIQVIDCVFQDDGRVKSVYAKRARGLMCRYLIQNRVDSVDAIKKFDLEGYVFSAKASSDSMFVFNRTAAKQKEVLKQIQAKAKRAKELAKETMKEDVRNENEIAALEPAPRRSVRKKQKTT